MLRDPLTTYPHVLIALDFSHYPAEAVRAVMRLELEKHAAVSVLHVFDHPAAGPLLRAPLNDREIADLKAQKRAAVELTAFLRDAEFSSLRRVPRAAEASTADAIRAAAAELSANLVVVGTHGTGSEKLLLGSVTEDLFRAADCDAIAVPPSRARPAQ